MILDHRGKVVSTLGVNPPKVHSFVSPYKRTRQTYAEMKRGGFVDDTYLEDPRLREHEYRGKLEAMDKAQIGEMKDQGRFWYRFTGGESMADCYDRACSFHMDRIEPSPDPSGGIGVITTHGTWMRTYLMRLLNWTVDDYVTFHTPANGSVIELEYYASEEWVWKSGYIKQRIN